MNIGVSTECKCCSKRKILAVPFCNRNQLAFFTFACNDCRELNLVIQSALQIEGNLTFALGIKFDVSKSDDQEVMVGIFNQLLRQLCLIIVDEEVCESLKLSKVNSEKVKIGFSAIAEKLNDPDTQEETLRGLSDMFQITVTTKRKPRQIPVRDGSNISDDEATAFIESGLKELDGKKLPWE